MSLPALPDDAPVWVYVTAATAEEARDIGHAAVGERLAACANVIDGMTSIYCWEGEVQENPEAVLVLKTRFGLIGSLSERVRSLHSYDVPCIVALPIVGGDPTFLAWIDEETAPKAP